MHSLSQMVALFLHLSNMGLTLLDAVLAVEVAKENTNKKHSYLEYNAECNGNVQRKQCSIARD